MSNKHISKEHEKYLKGVKRKKIYYINNSNNPIDNRFNVLGSGSSI